MTDFLNKNSVLVLNSLYMPIGSISGQKAIIAMLSDGVEPSAKAIDIQYGKKEDGSWDFDNVIGFRACNFEEWLFVPIREGLDKVVHTCRTQIRLPTVLLVKFSKMPLRKFRPTKTKLWEMQDGGNGKDAICGYSGKRLKFSKMNIEHKIPKSRNGSDSFGNLMLVDKDINHKRGNRPLNELGLSPLFHHNEPKPIPVCFTIKNSCHPDWDRFLNAA
jgi:5-methylcytosine-specific restriction endonuclease McrA